jgi:hypothetical protein
MTKELVYQQVKPKSAAGRKTNVQRLELKALEIQTAHKVEAEAQRLKRIVETETKRARPLLPDTKLSLVLAVALVSILMIASFTVSFAGIYQVAAYTGLPVYLQWLPALFIDAAILAYTISLIIFKSRGHSTWRTLAGLGGFAALSIAANVTHTLAFWHGDLADYRAWVGVAITAAAPIAVLLASEEIARLAFVAPDKA